MTKACVAPPQLEKHIPPKRVYLKIWNLEQKYGATKVQLLKKTYEAQKEKAYTTKGYQKSKFDAFLRGPKETPTILVLLCPYIHA